MSRAGSRIPPVRRRALPIGMLLIGAMTMGAIAAAGAGGVRINVTASMPRGLWQVQAGEPIERGAVVAICPPNRADILEASRRGYIPAGQCPGGYEPLVKPVAAQAGDLVTVTPAGVVVDGRPVANSRPLARDEADRTLQAFPVGSYRVPRGELWLLSGYDPRSFDSRYFGAVPAANVIGVARPLWVLR